MYVKLFSSILTSSVWAEDTSTRIVWITLLALADKEGDVRSSPSGLARLANVTLEDCQAALSKFLSPDPESGTQEHEGRRIEERPAGWHIINYAKYREILDIETRKEQWRKDSKTYREKKRQPPSASRQMESAVSAQAEAEAVTKAETTTTTALDNRFEQPDERAAYQASRRAARMPASFDAMLCGVQTGITTGKPVPWSLIGRAIVEIQATDGKVTANALRAFCRKLVEPMAGDDPDERRKASLLKALESVDATP